MENMTEIRVTSSLDGSAEPSLLYVPEAGSGVPLVVGLHCWSHRRDNQVTQMLPRAVERGWGLLLPEFRGDNLTGNPRAPEACASELAMQDIADAVDHVLGEHSNVFDPTAVFVLGGSGGGHMALMMAGYCPQRWRFVSAWCPITDLAAWHGENPNYLPHIVACCGGDPSEAPEEYAARSPITYVPDIAGANVHIYHGRWDPSVPFTHSLGLYNRVVAHDPEARCYLSIFDGGHELRYVEAFAELDACSKGIIAETLSS